MKFRSWGPLAVAIAFVLWASCVAAQPYPRIRVVNPNKELVMPNPLTWWMRTDDGDQQYWQALDLLWWIRR